MPSWVGQALRRGILTTRYPAEAATEDEVPPTGRPPVRTSSLDPSSACPVGAIGPKTLDQGKCIRCARCLSHGFSFAGPVEASTRTREALVVPDGGLTPDRSEPLLAALRRSLHLFLVDGGSCGACNLEVLSLSNPYYDLARLGMFFTNSPRHADVLLVVGVPTHELVSPLRLAYEALPAPKVVVAVGACPISGGAFGGNPGLRPSLLDVLPVDVFVPGCPPSPVVLLDAPKLIVRARREPGRGAP